ncbi:hypothetical protein [Microbulbifer hydrolyticus]|uniref:Integron Cassette Protein Hfx-Cass5 domain-containing protein n=1 Tax=Microbulbifer hydrolyticus TaxID=48074 RepID=A0A6P1T989_9GAMM|nr:hypothetical protein [Microbulbifer hydrolyticus]MBB5213319.1 hypothetical protein [Microbulbifer hydrolyticus]QHQ38597.1 hypothetical protein GTQ55_06085 [Microbulbifer hydrolyticus]
MEIEEISKIEILENGEMFVVLASGGKPMYQYVYREAAEVYWDNEIMGFKAPTPRKWSHSVWFRHIVSVVASGLGVDLKLSSATSWVNVPEKTKAEICAVSNT